MPTFDKMVRPQDDFLDMSITFGFEIIQFLQRKHLGTFYVLRDKSSDTIKKIVEELLNKADSSLTRDQKLIKTFFRQLYHSRVTEITIKNC